MSGAIEATVRLSFFFGVLLLMALWELLAPRRPLTIRKTPRWTSNLALVVLNTIAVRLAIPITAVGAALVAESHGWGLLPLVDGPRWLKALVAIVSLDLAIYVQHVLFHAIPVLWRLHRVHHADLDIDVTTGLRFHTLEILLSALIKLGVVLVLGPPAVAVVIFEVLLNATSMFNHSNIRIPGWIDRLLRLVVVTPDMHRVHHSVIPRETNSNFGFNLPWWDYFAGTYRPQPESGHGGMTIGLAQFREERQVARLPGILLLPFQDNLSGGCPADTARTISPMDKLAKEYDLWFDSVQGRELFGIELACVREVLGNHVGRWLEVGVGTGRFASALGIRDGVDPSEPALLLAGRRGIDACQGRAEQLPYSDESFDGILIVTTLCFIPDPQIAMREFHRVLRPGGRLVVGMIPADSTWGRLYAQKAHAGHPFYSAAHFHTACEVISLAEHEGFTFVRAGSSLLSPPGSTQPQEVKDGTVHDAGFVCLGFSRSSLPASSSSDRSIGRDAP